MSGKSVIVVTAAESQMGNPYVYGAWGDECTVSLRKKYARMNPAHADNIYKKCPRLNGSGAKTCDGCKWQGKLAFDCRGFTYWCLKQAGIILAGGGATSQYNTAANWIQRGAITSTAPDVVCCVFQRTSTGVMQHTGLHIGGGKIIHCSAGVQTGKITDKGWTHYAVPVGLYTQAELDAAPALLREGAITLANLKKGSNGAAVSALQEMLTKLGYDCGGIDGIFGARTQVAVRAFQAANGLTVDGIAGQQTQAALAMKAAQVSAVPTVEPATWTVTIRGLDAAAADKLLQTYPTATKTGE